MLNKINTWREIDINWLQPRHAMNVPMI